MAIAGEEDREAELLGDPAGETAVFGREVELFIDSDPIGQFIIDRAKRDLADAQEALLEVDPSKPEEVRKLQNKAAVANSVRRWLAEAIQDGRAAAAQLQLERDEHGA
jgi:hypothetical protein